MYGHLMSRPSLSRMGGRGETGINIIPRALDPEAPEPTHPRDLALASRSAAVLDHHYPGFNWVVTADHRTGLVTFKSGRIKIHLGMNLYLDRINDGWDFRKVVRFGGEYLERFGFRRGRAPDIIDPDILPESSKR